MQQRCGAVEYVDGNNVTLSEDIHTIYMLIKVGRCSGCKSEINFVCVIRENKTRGTLQKDGEKSDRKWLGWIFWIPGFCLCFGYLLAKHIKTQDPKVTTMTEFKFHPTEILNHLLKMIAKFSQVDAK